MLIAEYWQGSSLSQWTINFHSIECNQSQSSAGLKRQWQLSPVSTSSFILGVLWKSPTQRKTVSSIILLNECYHLKVHYSFLHSDKGNRCVTWYGLALYIYKEDISNLFPNKHFFWTDNAKLLPCPFFLYFSAALCHLTSLRLPGN